MRCELLRKNKPMHTSCTAVWSVCFLHKPDPAWIWTPFKRQEAD